MLSLHRKFGQGAVLASAGQKIPCPAGMVYANPCRELICDNLKTQFTVGEDVYIYFADHKAIWYSCYKDLQQGNDLVVRVDVNNISLARKGILDEQNRFLFMENQTIYCLGDDGVCQPLFRADSLSELLRHTRPMGDITLLQLETVMDSAPHFEPYGKEEFLEDITQLYSLVHQLKEERQTPGYTSPASAQIIGLVAKMCGKNKRNFTIPLAKLMEEELL